MTTPGGGGKKQGLEAQSPTAATAAQQFLGGSTKLAAVAMQGADRATQVTVYVLYIVSGGCVIALLLPPYEVLKQLIVLAIMIGAILYSASLIVPYYRDIERYRLAQMLTSVATAQVAGTAGPTALRPGWPPLTELQLDHLAGFVEKIRKEACVFLRGEVPALDANHVRSNIFFPFRGQSDRPDDFVLMIHPRLHCRMENVRELSIDFEPGQGLTGQVFQGRTPGYTKILDSQTGEWDAIFRLTREQKRKIDPHLVWIVSMPLKYWDGTSMGVVNVDGLLDDLSQDTLKNCLQSIVGSAVLESTFIWPPPP